MADVRSSVSERSWEGRSHFLVEGGRARQLGTTVVGSRSPAVPALIRPAPLSRTTTFDDIFCWLGCVPALATGERACVT